MVLLVLVVAIGAPVVEELFFRLLRSADAAGAPAGLPQAVADSRGAPNCSGSSPPCGGRVVFVFVGGATGRLGLKYLGPRRV
ncbi:MAG: hypothetical protein H6518_13655 [Microthrixaceae bacterium]|nr:hypothetical protein [Microthrixaceae bacterium]